jgi:hypothetical protein
MNWNTGVIIICILLTFFVVRKEYIRLNKARLYQRIIAVIVVVAAMACIALPLTYQADIAKQDNSGAVLLTEGLNTDSLSRYSAEKLFTLNNDIKKTIHKAVLLNNVDDLVNDFKISRLRILGNGLNAEDLQQLNHLPVIFNFNRVPVYDGITAISWNEKLKIGEELNIQGSFKNSSAKKIKLILKGLSTGLDSISIGTDTLSSFNLSTIPKSVGNNIYSLLAIAGTDTIERETIPVQIEPVKPLKVLILTASPDFEIRFLKNWLAEKGYSIAVRSAISKEKFNREFINMQQFSLDHLSASWLGQFDVLIGDLAVLKTFNGADAAVLQQAVTQKGLGVVIRADSTQRSNSWLQRDFPSDRLAGKDPLPVSLVLQGKIVKSAKLNVGLVYINNQNNTQSLVSDEHGHVLAGSTLAGAGKLVFTPLNNTFSWVLNGNKNDYANLWSLLIAKAARVVPVAEHWSVLSAIPSLSNPVQLQLETATNPSSIKIGEANIAPLQNSFMPFEWRVSYRPQVSGWQSVKQANGLLNWFYIYKDNDWKNIRTLKKLADTKAYIVKNAISLNVTKQIHEKITIAVSKIYFYVLLLIAFVYLWVEAKFL